METKETLVFNKYDLDIGISPEQYLSNLNSHMYSDENGLGFSSLQLDDNVIEANLIIRTPTSNKVYDPVNGMFLTNVVYLYDEVEIFIDLNLNLIYSTASIAKFNKAKTLLRNSLKSKIVFRNLDLSPIKLLRIIETLNLNPFISDLTIRNFQYKEGESGRYTVHIDSPYIGNELLSMYNENVSKVCIKLESSQFADFTLSNSSQNSITLKSQECDFWSIVNLLKVYL